jgi:hypothetical protein
VTDQTPEAAEEFGDPVDIAATGSLHDGTITISVQLGSTKLELTSPVDEMADGTADLLMEVFPTAADRVMAEIIGAQSDEAAQALLEQAVDL